MPSRLLRCYLGSALFAALAVALVFLLAPATALAQAEGEQPDTTQNKLLLPLIGGSGPDSAVADEAVVEVAGAPAKSKLNLIVDTDMGVDDAVALIWLFSQSPKRVNVLGIVTVAGNTSITNATNSALTVVWDWLNRPDIQVIRGAEQPLVQKLSPTGLFLHGSDGLWGLGTYVAPSNLRTDVENYYCAALASNSNPTVTVLALGPPTNLALAYEECPDQRWKSVNIIALGGAKFGGNATPVAEYNFWQDPEAASIVLTNMLTVTMVPLDAFTMPTIDFKDVEKLAAKGSAAAKKLAPALYQYVDVQIFSTGRANIPDAVAAVYALDRGVGAAKPALVEMVLQDSAARGQSVVALTYAEHVQLSISDDFLSELAGGFPFPQLPFDIKPYLVNLQLFLQQFLYPDNAQFVTSVKKDLLTKTVLPDLSK